MNAIDTEITKSINERLDREANLLLDRIESEVDRTFEQDDQFNAASVIRSEMRQPNDPDDVYTRRILLEIEITTIPNMEEEARILLVNDIKKEVIRIIKQCDDLETMHYYTELGRRFTNGNYENYRAQLSRLRLVNDPDSRLARLIGTLIASVDAESVSKAAKS